MTLDWRYTEPFIYLKKVKKKQPNQRHYKESLFIIKLEEVVIQRKLKHDGKIKIKSWQLERILKKTREKCVTLFTSNRINLIQLIQLIFFPVMLSSGFQLKETEDENRHSECHVESRKWQYNKIRQIRPLNALLKILFNNCMVRIGIRGSKGRDKHNRRRIAASGGTLALSTAC